MGAMFRRLSTLGPSGPAYPGPPDGPPDGANATDAPDGAANAPDGAATGGSGIKEDAANGATDTEPAPPAALTAARGCRSVWFNAFPFPPCSARDGCRGREGC